VPRTAFQQRPAAPESAVEGIGEPGLEAVEASEDGFPAWTWTWTLQNIRHVTVFGASILTLAALAIA